MTQLNSLSIPLNTGSLQSYIGSVNTIPMLTQEQEHELASRFQQHGDVDAARQLVMSHLRFVVKVARGYNGYGLAQNDLIQEGNLGLMKAVKRFDPTIGVRLVTFAVHWIRAEMHEFILKNWRIVKVATTKEQRKLFFNLRKAKKRLSWLNPEEVKEVADDLGVKPQTVLEMEKRLNAHDAAFDPVFESEDDEMTFAPSQYLQDQRLPPESRVALDQHTQQQSQQLAEGLGQLDTRAREIISRRWLRDQKATLQELAADFSVSAERIRQLEKAAMEKLRASMGDDFLITAPTR